MQPKMQKFLTSLGLFEIDRFDMRFTMLGRNPNRREEIMMFIEKQTPWSLPLLEEFMTALAETVRYPYSIRFSYVDEISPDDVILFFHDYTFCHIHFPRTIALKEEEGGVYAYFDEDSREQDEKEFQDFEDLLNFAGYPKIKGKRSVKTKKPEEKEAKKEEALPSKTEENASTSPFFFARRNKD